MMSDQRIPYHRFARIFDPAARLIVFGLLLIMVFGLAFAVKAAPNLVEDPIVNRAYLPIVSRPQASPPRLTSPGNGAVLNTLIPTFEWKEMGQPKGAWGCIAFDVKPNPTACYYSFSMGYGESGRLLSWWNLLPATKYYWRIGAIYDNDFEHPNWSKEWTFTTGKDGKIPSAPKLISPADNASISYDRRLYTWSAVSGAVEYSMYMKNIDNYGGYIFFTTDTKIDLRNVTSNFFKVDANYEWYVNARNDYAWSPASTPRTFTLTSVLNSALRSLSPEGLRGIEFIEEQPDGRLRFTIPPVK